MRKFIKQFIIQHFYTAEELFVRIRGHKLNGVHKFITYLRKHDPDTLERILQTSACTDYFLTPLDSAIFRARYHSEGFQIVIALLESSPRLYATLFEWNPGALFHAIDHHELPELRLLFWYVHDNALSVRDPKTGLTAEQLILDHGQRYVAFQVRAWGVDPRVAQEYSAESAIMLSWNLTKERLRLIQKAETELAAKHYELALEAYKRLKDICVEYAQLEARTDYACSLAGDAKPHLVRFYQDYGQRYVQEAYKVCELWLQKFNADPATLSREQLAEYRNALTHTVTLAQQLGNGEAEQRYTAILSRLPIVELSPAATAAHVAPAQVIISDPTFIRSPHENQVSIQHINSLEEDPCCEP